MICWGEQPKEEEEEEEDITLMSVLPTCSRSQQLVSLAYLSSLISLLLLSKLC